MSVAPAQLELIDSHLARYPVMEAQDVYKLLYQGLLGPEHLVADPEAFRARLLAEYESATADAHEPLYEPVRPDGRLLRVNLRPFKAQGVIRSSSSRPACKPPQCRGIRLMHCGLPGIPSQTRT